MTDVHLIQTFIVAVIAGTITYGVTPLAGRLAGILRMQDVPSGRKIHGRAVPYLGGLGILGGWAVVFLRPETIRESFVLLAGMAVFGVVGFIDDKRGLDERTRLAIQIIVAVAAFGSGIRMSPLDNLLGVQSVVLDLGVTVLWLVGMTNAFNFMDNMDGLAAGVGGIAALALGVVGILFGQQLVSLLGFGLAGALLGFLRHNFHPARIFMGDAGSLPLGFGLAVLALKLEFTGVHPLLALSIPVVILGLFIADTTVMAMGRLLRREPVIGARLDHVSHRLLQRGLSVPRVAALMYSVAAILAVAGIAASQLSLPAAVSMLGCVGVGAGFLMLKVLHWEPLARPDDRQHIGDQQVATSLV